MTGTGAPPTEPRLPWEAERLRAQLTPHLPGVVVQAVARCASTSTELVERARVLGDAMVPCLLVAEQQTAGRGRLGRAWSSAAGASLTFTLALPLAPRSWSGLSLAVGLALAEALDGLVEPAGRPAAPRGLAPAPRIALKWPNDLWLPAAAGGRGAKLGGVLVETVPRGARRTCVVGVGINVQPLPPPAAAGLEGAHASLHELDASLTAPATLAAVALPLLRALQAFEREGFAPLVERYAQRDVLRGREVSASGPSGPLRGRAEGVDAQGALLLRDEGVEGAEGAEGAGGHLHRIVSGEVSVRISGSAAPRRAAAGTGLR